MFLPMTEREKEMLRILNWMEQNRPGLVDSMRMSHLQAVADYVLAAQRSKEEQ